MRPYVTFESPLERVAPLFSVHGCRSTRSLGDRGLFLGYRRREPVFIDPWYMKDEGIIEALTFMTIGDINCGKTTLVKVLMLRFALLMAKNGGIFRMLIEDIKRNLGVPEYQKLITEGFNADQYDLSTARLNLFDPAMVWDRSDLPGERDDTRQQAQLIMVASHARTRGKELAGVLSGEEISVLKAALLVLRRLPVAEQYLLSYLKILNDPQLVEPTLSDGTPIRTNIYEHQRACRSLLQTFARLDGGDYGHMFSGTNSALGYMSQPIVGFDYTGMDQHLLSLLQAVLWDWRDQAQANHDPRLAVDFFGGDENHAMWEFDSYGLAMARLIKTIRMTGGMVMLNSHRPEDWAATGSRHAENMQKDIFGHFIGKVPHEVALGLQSRFEFSHKTRRVIEEQGQGEFVFLTRNRRYPPMAFKLHLTPWEEEICYSNQANDAMLGVTEGGQQKRRRLPRFRRRALAQQAAA